MRPALADGTGVSEARRGRRPRVTRAERAAELHRALAQLPPDDRALLATGGYADYGACLAALVDSSWRPNAVREVAASYRSPGLHRRYVAVGDAVLRADLAAFGGVQRPRDAVRSPGYLRRARQWRSRRTELDQVATAVACAPWPGDAGATDRVALEYLLFEGYRLGSPVVGYAVTSLMTAALLHRKRTAQTALQRLQENGWLQIVELAKATRATTYRLIVPYGVHVPGPADDERVGLAFGRATARGAPACYHQSSEAVPEAFSSRDDADGLGLGGWVVYRSLRALEDRGDGPEPVSVAEVARASDRSWPAARRTVDRLVGAGLAQRHDAGYLTVEPVQEALEIAAGRLGTRGHASAVADEVTRLRLERRRWG